MIEWSEQHQMIREAVRRFVEAEIAPRLDELEHGDTPPHDTLRKLYKTFGMGEMARSRFDKQIAREESGAAPSEPKGDSDEGAAPGRADQAAMTLLPIIELCRYCPGMVTAMGVSVGLTASAIVGKGTLEQKKRWARDLLTLDKVGAWAITEPGSGSDAFGGMKSTSRAATAPISCSTAARPSSPTVPMRTPSSSSARRSSPPDGGAKADSADLGRSICTDVRRGSVCCGRSPVGIDSGDGSHP